MQERALIRAACSSTLVAVAALIEPGPAAAQSTASSETRSAGQDAEARQLYDAGTVAYREGRYDNALEYMQRAYELSARPALLFNLGTIFERLRRDDEALSAYERYLAEQPDAENRADVEARIAIVRRAIGERRVSTPGPAGTNENGEGSVDAGPWVLVGLGMAVAVTGGVLLGLAAADVAAVEGAPSGSYWSLVSDAYSRSEAESIAGAVLLGVGGVAAATGIVWAVIPSSGETPSVTLAPAAGGFTLRGSF